MYAGLALVIRQCSEIGRILRDLPHIFLLRLVHGYFVQNAQNSRMHPSDNRDKERLSSGAQARAAGQSVQERRVREPRNHEEATNRAPLWG